MRFATNTCIQEFTKTSRSTYNVCWVQTCQSILYPCCRQRLLKIGINLHPDSNPKNSTSC